MSNYFDWRSGLTGGGTDDVDGIDGDNLTAGDFVLALDLALDFIRPYVVEDPIGEAESSPYVIIPDTNAGTKGLRQYRIHASNFFIDSNDVPGTAPVITDGAKCHAWGDQAVVNTPNGTHNVISGGFNNSMDESSGTNGYCVISGGASNNLTDCIYAVIAGGYDGDIDDGDYSVIGGGRQNVVTANYAAIMGGYYGKAYLYGQEAWANGGIDAEGDCQRSILFMYGETTDATQTELYLDYSAAQAVLPASRTWRFSIDVAARQTAGSGGTVGDSAIWTITGGIKRDGSNNTALIGTPQGTGAPGANDRDAGAATWDVTITADDTNEALKIEVTGEVNETIRWSAKIELVEVG